MLLMGFYGGEEGAELFLEFFGREAASVIGDGGMAVAVGPEFLKYRGQRLGCWLVEKLAVFARQNIVKRTAGPIGDHRCATGHCLKRRDAKIIEPWK